MPAGPVGSVWAIDSWLQTVYEAGAWADAAGIPVSPDVIVRVRGHQGVAQANAFTIQDGGLITKDPSDAAVYQFDWDAEFLGASASIASSEWAITAIRPSGDEELAQDDDDIVESDRQTQVRLTGGTLGATYRIDNAITTNENPDQVIERSCLVKIEQR